MKGILLKSILSAALVVSFTSHARGQQTNIHVTVPPLISADTRDARQISASYIKMHGEGIDSNGMDINTAYRTAVSDTSTSEFTLGAALLGSILGGEMDVDTLKRDVSGVVIHANFGLEYLVVKGRSSSLALFVGIPLSFGNFIVEDEEDVTVFNFMTGFGGGARFGLDMGDFTGSPLVMVNLMGGYIERYGGGVYLENLDSGGIPIFAVVTSGLEILYRPLGMTLGGIYQRTFGSGENRPVDTAMVQLGFSF